VTPDKAEQLTVEVQSGNSKIKFNTGVTISVGVSMLFGLGMIWQQNRDSQALAKGAATKEEVRINRANIDYNTARIDSLNVWLTRQNQIAHDANERDAERFSIIIERLQNIEKLTIGHDLGSEDATKKPKKPKEFQRDWNPMEQIQRRKTP